MSSYDLIRAEERERDDAPDERDPREEELVRLSERIFQNYRSQQDNWAQEAANNVDLKHNIPFTKEQVDQIKARGLAPVGIPLLHQVVKQYVAMLTTGEPAFQATATEDSDTRTARAYTDLFTHIWRQSKGNQRLRRIVEDDFVQGRGVFYVYIDPRADSGRGEVLITELDPKEVYPDPNSREKDWSDAAHIIFARTITREQAEATWPQFRDKIAQASPSTEVEHEYSTRRGQENQTLRSDINDTEHDHYDLVCRYTKILVPHYFVVEGDEPDTREKELTEEDYEAYREQRAYAIRTQEGDYYAYQDEEVGFYDNIYLQMGGDGEAVDTFLPIGGQATPVTLLPITKGLLVDAGEIFADRRLLTRIEEVWTLGKVLLYRRILPTSHYPIIPLNTEHNRTPYPTSDATQVRPIIEEYNKKQQIIIAHATSIAGAKYWARDGAVDDSVEEKLSRPTSDILSYYSEEPPQPHQVHQLPGEFYVNQDRLQRSLYDAVGMYPFQQGDPSDAPDTVRGTLMVHEASTQRIKNKIDDLEEALNQVGRVVTDLIPHVYKRRKIIRLMQPSGPARETVINEAVYDDHGQVIDLLYDVTAGRYDIRIVSGSTLPSPRWALREEYKQMLELIGPAFLPEFLKKSEIPNWDEVLARWQQEQSTQAQLAQAEEQIKRLQGDLQTREREVYHAKQQEALAKFTKSLEAPKQKSLKEAELFTQRLQDELQGRKALISQIDEI